MSISQVGSIAGTVAPSESSPGQETVQLPAKLGISISSVSLLGLKIPTNCTIAESVAVNLGGTVTHEELMKTGWSAAGRTTLPRFKCEGGFLGLPFGQILTALLSGPENLYLLNITAPS